MYAEKNSLPSGFWLLDGRNYVHGTTVFARFLEALDQSSSALGLLPAAPPAIASYKIAREVRNQGWIEVRTSQPDPVSGGQAPAASAEMSCLLGERKVRILLYESGDAPVTDRRPDETERMLSEVRPSGDIGGSAHLVGVAGMAQLVAGLIRVNKELHQAALAPSGDGLNVRWLYLLDMPPLSFSGQEWDVVISSRCLQSMKRGMEVFTVCAFSGSFGSSSFTTKICFRCFP